jgi:RHS repeat-associated protein
MNVSWSRSLVVLLLVVLPSAVASYAQSSACALVSNNPLVLANLCGGIPKTESLPAAEVAISRGSAQPLTLTAEQINKLVLDDPPAIRSGDALVFEANRGDFILEVLLSNGKEIVTQLLNQGESENMSVAWRKGRVRLDYPASISQRIVGMKVTPLHAGGMPVMFRGIKVDRQGRFILELEKAQPGQKQAAPEPPASYPADPRVVTVSTTSPSLLGGGPRTGYLTRRLPAFSMRPMMFQSTSTGDPNHYKYIGQELDAETGLYYMRARHYSPGLGRFIQPDPLYIDMKRLADPQQLNLYVYGRNNPTTFSDPTGLDVKFNCDNKANCNQAVQDFNGRKNGQFRVELGKDNKLHVVKGSVQKNLSTAEKALMGAVNDANNHATINVVGNSGQSEFGVHNGAGVNSVDLGNISKLDAPSNAGGLNSGDALAHESMDAYYSLSNDALLADHMASGLFPGLGLPTGRTFGNVEEVLGQVVTQPITDGRGSERQMIILNTPIPRADLQGKTDAQKDKMFVDAGSHVQGVTFEKPKQ